MITRLEKEKLRHHIKAIALILSKAKKSEKQISLEDVINDLITECDSFDIDIENIEEEK